MLSYHLQKNIKLTNIDDIYLIESLRELNQERINIAEKIARINKNNMACMLCNGLCCRGNYDHFYSLDYLIRYGSDNQIANFGMLDKPRPLLHVFINYIVSVIRKIDQHKNWKEKVADSNSKCCYWREGKGYMLSIKDMPMRCQLFSCNDYRKGFNEDDFYILGLLMRKLYLTGLKAYKKYCNVVNKKENLYYRF
jgi:hypothetical protein